MTRLEIKKSEYLEYFNHYISLVPQELDLLTALKMSCETQLAFYKAIPEDKIEYRYSEGKWTSKEILGHIIDTERVFAYRALRVARNDKTPMPGYNENDFAAASNANSRTMKDLLEEFELVRLTTIMLFKSFTAETMMKTGKVDDNTFSVRALGFIIAGHETHHLNIIKERYL